MNIAIIEEIWHKQDGILTDNGKITDNKEMLRHAIENDLMLNLFIRNTIDILINNQEAPLGISKIDTEEGLFVRYNSKNWSSYIAYVGCDDIWNDTLDGIVCREIRLVEIRLKQYTNKWINIIQEYICDDNQQAILNSMYAMIE